MADSDNWAFPEAMRSRADEVAFDLAAVIDAVVTVRAVIPDDAFTAETLGTERIGNGVVIGQDGIVLTMGYLITEASHIWLTTNRGGVVPGYPIGYDQETGFGLVKALGTLDTPVLARGSAAACRAGDQVHVVSHGGQGHALSTRITTKHEFAGYWEYLLDEAIFTSPAHPQWGGAAVVDNSGKLIGIGSLLVQESSDDDDEATQANMVVPIDLLEPVLDDMLRLGRPNRDPRPWLGLYPVEAERHLAVGGLAANGPAAQAGLEPGDLILAVGSQRVDSLAWFFREVWQHGPAGTVIPLTIAHDGDVIKVDIRSADRNDFLKKPSLH